MVYKITCRQCDNVYIGETIRKFGTQMKEHAKSKAKRDDKLLFEKHCCNEGRFSEAADRNSKHSTQRPPPRAGNLRSNWRLWGRKREGKQVLMKKVTKFECEKLFGSQPIENIDFMVLF